MHLTVLGCWAPYPAPNQACSGYLLETSGKLILIDLGHGAFGKLQKLCDFSRLDAVFISHLHPDHCADLSCLRHAVLGAKRQGKEISLPLYTPCEPNDKFQVLANYEDAFELHVLETASRKKVKIAGRDCEIFRTEHSIPAYGLGVYDQGEKFIYTGDTGWKESLVEICRDADVLLCEASVLEQEAHLAGKGHLTAGQAGTLAQKAGVKKLVLTHLWPGYQVGMVLEEGAREFDGDVKLAAEFGEYF